MALMAATGTLEDQSILAKFIAKLVDFGISGHRQFLTWRHELVHPVLAGG
jgi:hypothetical protein